MSNKRVFGFKSIRSKIFFFTIVVVFISTISVEVVMLRFHRDTILNSTFNLAVTKADFVASNSAGMVVFNDQDSMTDLFETLKLDINVIGGYVYQYDESGLNSFSSYTKIGTDKHNVTVELINKESWTDTYIEVSRVINVSGNPVGLVVLHYDTADLRKYEKQSYRILLLGLLIASVITFVISSVFLNRFVRPIRSLVNSTRNIAQSRDYSVRVDKLSEDEMGDLADNFNEMMAVIYRKDEAQREKENEIKKLNENLETRVRERTLELEHAKERAELAAEAKASFLANMSHEIRTPMNAIIGFLAIVLEKPELPEGLRHYVITAYNSGKNLLGIINDILDVSKLNSGKMELENAPFNLDTVIKDVLIIFDAKAKEKKLTLTLKVEGGSAGCFVGDAARLRQVLINLIGNALKFTEKGSLTVSVYPMKKEGGVLFSIADTGIGIPEERLNSIFASFSQADVSTTRRYGGTGLGTTISKQIVELMGGVIWAESEVGVGSTFNFAVLLEPCDVDTTLDVIESAVSFQEKAPTSPRCFSILLAEDVPENAELAMIRLKEQQHKVTLVQNGKLAVYAFKKDDFDLIIMDVHMPEMDGLEATRRIRAYEKEHGGHIAIVALTASMLKSDQSLCLDVGMDAVVGKPIDLNELLTTMEAVVAEGLGRVNTSVDISLQPDSDVDLRCLREVVDVDRALSIWHDASVYKNNFLSFIHSRDSDITEMCLAADIGDFKKVHSINHAIKGVAGNLVLHHLFAACDKVSSVIKVHEQEGADEALKEVKRCFEEAKTAALQLPVGDAQELPSNQSVDVHEIKTIIVSLNEALASGEVPDDVVNSFIGKTKGVVNKSLLKDFTSAVYDFDFDHAQEAMLRILEDLDALDSDLNVKHEGKGGG